MRFFLIVLCVVCVSGCSSPALRGQATEQGRLHGFTEHVWQTQPFLLYSLLRKGSGDLLHVYIEGDGHAWISPRRPSNDPTPHSPVALWLALQDPSPGSVCYLARPGQYIPQEESSCPQKYWTSARFSRDVLDSMNQAVDLAKKAVSAKRIVLVGFSGGGAVATLLASERDDVAFLATVGGNLDVGCWVRERRFTPLKESLDPASVAGLLHSVPQRHVLGTDDTVIPRICSRGFVQNVQRAHGRAEFVEVPGYGHNSPWQKVWNYTYAFQGKE